VTSAKTASDHFGTWPVLSIQHPRTCEVRSLKIFEDSETLGLTMLHDHHRRQFLFVIEMLDLLLGLANQCKDQWMLPMDSYTLLLLMFLGP